MSFKNLNLDKIKLAEVPYEPPKNQYKGNITWNFSVTKHVAERFAERFLNNASYNLDFIKEHMIKLVTEKGIEGYGQGKTTYVALPRHGLFIVQNNSLVTFLDERDLNRKYQDLYIKLLNKGRVK